MKQTTNENAANRSSYVGAVYTRGERLVKKEILDSMPKVWSDLHRNGYIHIHDLDAYGQTYNCLTFDFSRFPYGKITAKTDEGKIIQLFDALELMIEEYGNEQSGGMAFPNFDDDIEGMISHLGVKETGANLALIEDCIGAFIAFCNGNHTRMGLVSYYVTLNIGLSMSPFGKRIAMATLEAFESAGELVYKPNIVFKLKGGVNANVGDPNYDLFQKALSVTSKKMIPTYLLCDCDEDRGTDPKLLSIMGCRTRVVDDLYKKKGAIGRGNIDNISINLPRLALEIDRDYRDSTPEEKMETLKKRWRDVASTTKDILLDRYKKMLTLSKEDFPANMEYGCWCADFNEAKNLEDIFKHGTLSIGFIGLSEAIEVLTGKKYWDDADCYTKALGFVAYMRSYCDFLRSEYKLNFSLLATSGELISGRFTEIDRSLFKPRADIFSKGYYTNSFHVGVEAGLPCYKKIQLEGLFHQYCNGGSITYVELKEAPLGNEEGLEELAKIAVKSGVHYLGFNFPKDICKVCGASGVFDVCPNCGSKEITRIRRVSGYLEVLDGFTSGKKHEEANRKGND
jgi:ribonucleoside-triphosphate reductase (formate)